MLITFLLSMPAVGYNFTNVLLFFLHVLVGFLLKLLTANRDSVHSSISVDVNV